MFTLFIGKGRKCFLWGIDILGSPLELLQKHCAKFCMETEQKRVFSEPRILYSLPRKVSASQALLRGLQGVSKKKKGKKLPFKSFWFVGGCCILLVFNLQIWNKFKAAADLLLVC